MNMLLSEALDDERGVCWVGGKAPVDLFLCFLSLHEVC